MKPKLDIVSVAGLLRITNVLLSEFGIPSHNRATLLALWGASGGQLEGFEASLSTIANYLGVRKKQKRDGAIRALKRIYKQQEELGISLVEKIPSRTESNGGKKSWFRLPLMTMALEAYEQALKVSGHSVNPVAAEDTVARQMAHGILKRAKQKRSKVKASIKAKIGQTKTSKKRK